MSNVSESQASANAAVATAAPKAETLSQALRQRAERELEPRQPAGELEQEQSG